MTKKIQLSRRTLLASMGAIGAGAALGGAGTMALFNDEEVFEGNQLVAGELDLKVDWQQTYYGPEGLVYVSAFPDEDGDNHQDTLYTREDLQADPTLLGLSEDASEADIEDAYRGQFADVPNDLEAPLIDLQDVKPGDHGEVTFSVHLFDNPAYMWMHGDLVANDENDINEPESHVDDSLETGELADAIKARLWYDEDGDNVLDGADKLDVVVALDTSGSMLSEEGKFQNMLDGAIALRTALGSAANVSLVDFRSGALRPLDLTTDVDAFNNLVSGLDANGTRDADAFGYGTDMYDAIRVAHEELTGTAMTTDADGSATYSPLDPSGNDRDDAAKILVLLSNGGYGNDENPRDPVPAADAARDAGIEVYSIAYGSDSNDALLGDIADDEDHFFDVEDYDNIVPTFEEIADLITGEEIFVQGTLREVLTALGGGVALDGDRAVDGRQCYPNSTTQYFGFEWWLPIEVGNEVQSDSVEFDLRFYAEQCRHNDGATNPFEEVPQEPPA